jgi:hypothetical protein
MEVLERHTSCDQLLRLVVIRNDDGDISIGFEGNPWHTHADVLAAENAVSEAKAVEEFVGRILNDEQPIAIARVRGNIIDVWPTDDPAGELKYNQPDESLEFRYWNGDIVSVDK